MATGITVPFPKDIIFGAPTVFQEISLADQTASTSAQTLTAACRFISAYISIKTYVVGNASVGPIFQLLASSAVGMTTPVNIGPPITMTNTASATLTQCLQLQGMLPTAAGLGFIQVTVTLNGTSSIAYDIVFDAV